MANNYMVNLNSSLDALTKLNEKVTTGRKYVKSSEAPATALKAYQVRQNLSRLALYQNNISEVQGILSEVETSVSAINSILTDVMEQVLVAKTGTSNADDRKNIAQVIRNYQEQVYNVANTKFGGKYVFGGTDMNKMPFALTGNDLLYHGKNVLDDDFAVTEEKVFYDIGLGFKTDASGVVIPKTTIDIAYPGSEMFGTGKDSDGLPNNIYHLLGNIAQILESNDLTEIGIYTSKLEKRIEDNMLAYVNVGQKTNFTEFLKSRYETDEFNALSRQRELEGIDEAKAILDFSIQEMAYKAALQMGGKILQSSLLDYMS